MAKRNKETVVNTRKNKKAKEGRTIKTKFLEERVVKSKSKPLNPMNEKQAEYIRLLNEKSLVIATGLAGTSKTYIPSRLAAKAFLKGDVDTIFLTRPNISNSKSLGFFGGTLVEKMSNWLQPVLGALREDMCQAEIDCAIKEGNIQFIPFEVIKGMSFNNAWVICDEAEDINIDEAKNFVTRLGKNVHCAMAGDLEQSELKGNSGLKKLIELFQRRPNLENSVGMVDFNRPDDIVRSPLCKEWILAFREDEQRNN